MILVGLPFVSKSSVVAFSKHSYSLRLTHEDAWLHCPQAHSVGLPHTTKRATASLKKVRKSDWYGYVEATPPRNKGTGLFRIQVVWFRLRSVRRQKIERNGHKFDNFDGEVIRLTDSIVTKIEACLKIPIPTKRRPVARIFNGF